MRCVRVRPSAVSVASSPAPDQGSSTRLRPLFRGPRRVTLADRAPTGAIAIPTPRDRDPEPPIAIPTPWDRDEGPPLSIPTPRDRDPGSSLSIPTRWDRVALPGRPCDRLPCASRHAKAHQDRPEGGAHGR